MSFRPNQLGQYEPVTSTSAKDCVPTVTAQLVNRATVDGVRVNHAKVRSLSGAPATRGVYMAEAIAAAAKLGVKITGAYGISRNDLKTLLEAGHGVGLLINCAITRYTTRRTNYYTGPHCVYVQAYSWWPAGERCACELQTTTAHGEYSIEDPGTTAAGYLQWSAGLVYRAAESYGGGAAIYALVSPDTEIRPWKVVDRAEIRTEPTYSTGSRVKYSTVGAIHKGGRTQNGGRTKRADGTYGNGWTHIVISGTTPDTYKWGWIRGNALAQA